MFVAAVLATFALQVPAAASAAPTALLPDLRMEVPTQLTLEHQDGHYWLRFSAMITNVGAGPLEVRSKRRCPDCLHMRVTQAILKSDGTWAVRATKTQQRYDNSDGHHHWHVMGMERYELFPMDAPFANGPLTGHKRGFCFFDGYIRNHALPNFRPTPTYSYWGCGSPSSQSLRVGLSVGWGDLYPWDFAGQYVDLAGVAPGDYLVCLTADPSNWFRESKNGNNAAFAKIHIPNPSTLTTDRTPITAIASGQRSCQSQLPYTPQGAAAARRAANPHGASRVTSGAPGSRAEVSRTASGQVDLGGAPATTVWVPGADASASAGFYGVELTIFGCTIGGRANNSG